MKITEIKKIGKGLRYSVYIDEVFVCTFEGEILAKSGLKTGQEIEEDNFQLLKVMNGAYASFDKALGLLEHGMKSEKEVKDYLSKKGYPTECIERAIKKLSDYGYVNDEIYAGEFVKTYAKSRGEKRIKYDLITKGISREIIDEKLQGLDEESQFAGCKNFALKKIKNQILDAKLKQKVVTFLAGKGYGFSLINSVLRDIEYDRN